MCQVVVAVAVAVLVRLQRAGIPSGAGLAAEGVLRHVVIHFNRWDELDFVVLSLDSDSKVRKSVCCESSAIAIIDRPEDIDDRVLEHR